MEHESKGVLHWFEGVVKDDKKLRILIICGLSLVAVLFLASLFPKTQEKNETIALESISMEEYNNNLEKRVLKLISNIEGVGQAQVLLTLENGKETVFQSDNKRQSNQQTTSGKEGTYAEDTQDSVVLVEGADGKKQALVKTERTPAVQGIVVVCDGAQSIEVESRVTEALTAVFDISSTKVAVVLRSKSNGDNPK